jgi:hypothetical protein
MYRGGKVPTVVDYRDIESLPVVQKENCQKVAVTSMPTLAKAMTTALPAAPAGYEPMKVMTTDKEGDVYLAAPVQVVSPGLIPAIYDNCNKGLFKNVPALGSILGFGSDCKEFGSSTLKQLQEALSKVVGLAPIKTLPDTLRGYKGGEEFKYPVSLNAVKTASVITSVSGRTPVSGGVKAVFGKNTGPVLSEGLWLVAISFSGAVGWQSPRTDYLNFGLDTTIGVTYPVILANTSVADTQVSHSYNLQRFVTVPAGQSLALSAESFVFPGPATIAFLKGEVEFNAQQISQTNLVVNGVV